MLQQIESQAAGSEFFTPRELAAFLGMSQKWVVKHTQSRRIPGQVQFGRSWRYRKADVESHLNSGAPQFLLEKPHGP